MRKLRELLGTKYITDDHTSEMIKIFDSADEDKMFDLAGCKLMPNAEAVLRFYYSKLKFCNTENAELDKILKHNQIASKDKTMEIAVPLPIDLETDREILKFFRTIDKSKMYNLENCKVNKTRCLALAILLTMQGPDIVFDLKEYASDLFKQVRVDWLKYKEPHIKYNEVVHSAIVEREVIDGKVYKPGIGWLDVDLFIYDYNVLPIEFGTEYLNDSEEFREVWRNALTNLRSSVESVQTMKNYIEIIE